MSSYHQMDIKTDSLMILIFIKLDEYSTFFTLQELLV